MPAPKQRLKMFIVLRWDLPPEAAVVAAAHASLGTYLTFKDSNPLMEEWQKTSFIKKLCKSVSHSHFQHLKTLGKHRVFTESCLGNAEVSIGFDIAPPPYYIFDEIPLWTPFKPEINTNA